MWKVDVIQGVMLSSINRVCRRFVLLLLFMLPTIGEAEDSELSIESEQETKEAPHLIVHVGVREDARPFSYETPTGSAETVLAGFSGYMTNVCRHILKQMKTQQEYENIEFMAHKVLANKRFDDLNDNKVLFLCGPDSITDDLLDRFRPTLPVFLSGMTYAYVNPRSRLFPKGNYCRNIIGVVRGTTADKDGLRELTGKNMLMRFNKAVDLELSKQTEKDKKADERMREIIHELIKDFQSQDTSEKLRLSYKASDISALEDILDIQDPEQIHDNVDRLENTELSGLINQRMGDSYYQINMDIAKTIQTDECPRGFDQMPIRKYEDHTKGVEAFCAGEVLYYLGDFDIINSKIREYSHCNPELNRFTRTKEVYGVFFSARDKYYACNPENYETLELCVENSRLIPQKESQQYDNIIDVVRFRSEFNRLLFNAMQGKESAIERIFSKSFIGQEKTEELHEFFQNFKSHRLINLEYLSFIINSSPHA